MIPREHVEGILSLAVQAPSGDNAQPWRFEVRGEEVDLYNIPGKDYSPYNFRERGSFFANGALIENAVIAAASFGYATNATYFPTPSDQDHVARLTFLKQDVFPDTLVRSIPPRATNRKPYKKVPLTSAHRDQLFAAIGSGSDGKLYLLEDRGKITEFAATVSLSDKLIFEEKAIHDAIFGSIRWTLEEEEKKRGMYIKTLELPPPAQVLFKMLKNWSTLLLLNKIHISSFIASQSANVFAASSAIGMIMMQNDSNESYVRAGRGFERLWLTATHLNINLQPVGALAYLAERVNANDAGELSPEHAAQVVQAQKKINALFGNPPGTIAIMFRIGYGSAPTAHSRKAEPEVIYQT